VVEPGNRALSETLSRRPEPTTSSGPTRQKTTSPAREKSTVRSLEGSQGEPFFTTRLLGPTRAELLAADLGQLDHRAVAEQAASLDALRRSLDEIIRRQDRLVRTLESQDDPAGTVFARVRDRLGELEAERQAKLDTLAIFEATEATQAVPVELLDKLPDAYWFPWRA